MFQLGRSTVWKWRAIHRHFLATYLLELSLNALTQTYFEETFQLQKLEVAGLLEAGAIRAPRGAVDGPK